MFRRTFWFTSGVAAGVWATTKVNRKLKQLTPESLAATAANKAVDTGRQLRDRAVGFALDVRDGMARREAELEDALGIREEPRLPAPRRYTAIENHNGTKTYVIDSATPPLPPNETNQTNPTDPHPGDSHNRNEDH
ncbi:hypothetical protein ACIQNG_29480 [Streptomyces sp. NPDC091377]|uniref:hypothetical protein n=1 Tax=Streptomyces sp. NPDC091377 TaxID=3365995 RepID=UPI0037F76F59